MKIISVFLLLLTIMGGCATNSAPRSALTHFPEGFYTGNGKLFIIAYVKVSQGRAVADIIYKDKFPRDLLTDTLVYVGSSNSWKDKATSLYNKKGSWYIDAQNTLFASSIKLETNEKQYREHIHQHKNLAFLRKAYIAYREQSSDKMKATETYEQLVKAFDLNAKASKLNHEAFLKEYENFISQLKQ